ncbi:hypothetical protein [Nocardiopsis sp. NRRL B-16309]|uniref:hypothetical protein n=1 Tax=Nocardiopsis sp. NRRL B-16309 TaxID=1519494 RepID=UPI0006AF0A1D|nr:hypothetical protein [Nocardiopsis sp. NRRL B-16309]KOX10227.1 hypothetical protein ADL05_26565 [Nocardiopsis sp. NRRL B-16309]
MRYPKPYARIVRFKRVGLHTDVPDLVAQVRTHDDGRGPYITRDLHMLIGDHVRPLLAHDGDVTVDAHPDRPHGFVYGRGLTGKGPVLAEFSVHLDTEELPQRGVDHDEVRDIARMILPATRQGVTIRACRTGAVVRVDGGFTERVRDVLIGAGYTAHIVDNVVLVAVPES